MDIEPSVEAAGFSWPEAETSPADVTDARSASSGTRTVPRRGVHTVMSEATVQLLELATYYMYYSACSSR